jgi:hypothetical protein
MKKQTPPITITAPTAIPMTLDLPMLPPPEAVVVDVVAAVWVCVAVVGVAGAVTPPESGPPPEPAAPATAAPAPSSQAQAKASANSTADDLRRSLGTGRLSVN